MGYSPAEDEPVGGDRNVSRRSAVLTAFWAVELALVAIHLLTPLSRTGDVTYLLGVWLPVGLAGYGVAGAATAGRVSAPTRAIAVRMRGATGAVMSPPEVRSVDLAMWLYHETPRLAFRFRPPRPKRPSGI